MRRFLRILVSHPVEPLIGLLLLTMGGYAAAASVDVTVRTWGAIFAGLGGVLISWTTGTAYAREQALAEIDDRVLSLSRQLGTEASNIGLTVEQAQRGSVSADTCFALLSQSLNSLTNIVAEVQSQVGDDLDPQSLIATREKIAELTRTVSRDEGPSEADLEYLRQALTDISRDLRRGPRDARKRMGRRPMPQLVTETAFCPNCSAAQGFDLGNHAGATASARCGNCGIQFNVHRASNGAVFTRMCGVAGQGRELARGHRQLQ